MKLSRFFLPDKDTHKKAHLISVNAIFVYIMLFVVLQFGLKSYSAMRPDILGTTASVTIQDIISLTNAQRSQKGLSPLRENSSLNQAASAKAQNMFEENYWSHYSPSGKDPWGFISGSGYKFSYAGENLARNFFTSQEVVNAWMASPTHRDNLLNPNYQDIGIAISEGDLTGQKTLLIVQEFGSPVNATAQRPTQIASNNQPQAPPLPRSPDPTLSPSIIPTPDSLPLPDTGSTLVAGQSAVQPKLTIDPSEITKDFGLFIIFLLIVLILLDLYIIRRRAVTRLASRHVPHLALLSAAASVLWTTGGQVL